MNVFSRRFPTIIGLMVLAVGLAAGVWLVMQEQGITPQAAVSAVPADTAISNVSDRQFSVSWTTQVPATGQLIVGESKDTMTRNVLDDRDRQTDLTAGSDQIEALTHYVTVENLESSTTYYFRIKSGKEWFDQKGLPFSVTTGPMIQGAPASDNTQGIVQDMSRIPYRGAVVFAQLPGGQLLSSLSTDSGSWFIPLSTARLSSLAGWLEYDRATTTYSLQVSAASDGKARAIVTTGIDKSVPPIRLGNTYDFREGKEPISGSGVSLDKSAGETPEKLDGVPLSLFNFGFLGPATAVIEEVTLDNPADDGEIITTDQPELFGEGPRGTEIEVLVESAETIQGKATVGDSGRWSFAVPTGLSPGDHKITLRWVDAEGVLQILTRSFVVNASAGEAAFTATPSATPQASQAGGQATPQASQAGGQATPQASQAGGQATPTSVLLTPTVPPRSSMPATDSGVPESGNLTASMFISMIGILSIAGGLYLIKGGNRYG